MLQSNTDARSFKLQPAPRPKCKKRPQSCTSPPTPAAASTAFPIVDTSSDTRSLRSCFDDDDAPTPRASQFASPLSPRSSMSAASVASIRSSNSVARLLASLSVSPRLKTSPVATVPVVLTSQSPTPSSPLFPRRTLMRSLSATCMNAQLKSPTSPMTPSVDAKMRKRMGWRGALSARMQAETAILLSPGSPITPRRAEALHTPTQSSMARDATEAEIEPLSATLKRLGAKRRTERFASTCVPVQSPLQEEMYKSPDTARSESWQVMTATRKIFQLPSWVRFEANHHARTRAAADNRAAAAGYSKLQLERSAAQEADAMLPKVSHVGDVAPDSPNGELFAGFDVDLGAEKKQKPEWVVSVIRPPNMAALRTDKVEAKGSRVLGAVRSALPGLAPQRRIKGYISQDERDGWGGVTRSSWFRGYDKGPLVSPNPPAKQRGLKRIILQPARGEDEWEDIDEPCSAKPAPTSFLEMNDAPRFQPRVAASRWFPFRPSVAKVKDGKDWMGDIQLDTWRTKRLAVDKVASELVTKHGSVENRPVRGRSARTAGIVAALTAVLVVAIVAIVMTAKDTPVQMMRGGGASVANGMGPPTAVQPVLDPRQSSVAKAAHMSHT